MKKSIVAIAVSSAALASMSVHAADTSTVDIYGNIQYAYTDANAGSELGDNGSTFGFKGETKVNEDLTAFFKYELEADADENSKDVSVGLDQAFVGLKGSFGKVQVGTFDSIYNNAIQDSVDQFDNIGFSGATTTAEGDTLAYFSPSMNGLELQASVQLKDDAGTTKTKGNAFTGVAKYSIDALTLAVGYDSLENTAGETDTTGLSVGYDVLPNLNVTVKYETESDTQDIIGLAARYGYGSGDIYASAQSISPDVGDSYSEFAAGVSYSLASNVYVYGEVGSFENAKDSKSDTKSAVGVYYGF